MQSACALEECADFASLCVCIATHFPGIFHNILPPCLSLCGILPHCVSTAQLGSRLIWFGNHLGCGDSKLLQCNCSMASFKISLSSLSINSLTGLDMYLSYSKVSKHQNPPFSQFGIAAPGACQMCNTVGESQYGEGACLSGARIGVTNPHFSTVERVETIIWAWFSWSVRMRIPWFSGYQPWL